MDKTNNQPDWELIGRYLAGTATAEERARAEQWLAAHPEDARLLELVDSTAPAMAPPPVSAFEVEAALRKVKARMAPAPRIRTHHRWLAAAAVIAALGLWTLLRSREHLGQLPQLAAQASTGAGQVDTLFLDDGSRVILAPNTELTVTGRTASLRGQAYFDVVHDDRRPFLVRTDVALIRDLGTAFDVREDAEGVTVDVTEGVVDLRATADSTRQGVTLQRGDRGYIRRSGTAAVERGQVRGVPAWTAGQLIFQDASMAEIRTGLQRWYGVTLQVHDTVMEKRHLTATFGTESVDQALHILALAVGGTIERRGNTAILHSTPPSTAR